MVLLFVDDLVVAAPTRELVAWIWGKLHNEFEMRDLGPLTSFLGLEIETNCNQDTLHLSQKRYIENILLQHWLEYSNPALTPADAHVRLEKSNPEFEAIPENKRNNQSAVGSLMYAMLDSSPDISYAIAKVSQYSTNPDITHFTALKRIFRYLAGSPNGALCYGIHWLGSSITDADWGSSKDRRSIGGYTLLLNRAAICWNSKKQATVALSSGEGEYMTLTQALKESLWLESILQDLGARKHMEEIHNINIDIQGALPVAQNPQFHSRTKHLDIPYPFVPENVENKSLTLIYCPTGEMTADTFTKALPQPALVKHNIGLVMINHWAFVLQDTTSLTTREHTESHQSHIRPKQSPGEGWYCESPEPTLPWLQE